MYKIEQNRTNRKINREYKELDPLRILNMNETGIGLLACDEIFVESSEFDNLWVSNYGRAIEIFKGEYRLMNQYYDEKSKRYIYSLNNGGTTRKPASLVVSEFIVNPFPDLDSKSLRIWHLDGDFKNNYYKNLFPLTLHLYDVVKKYSESHKFITEDILINIMNGREYAATVFGVGRWGSVSVNTSSKAYKKWLAMLERCYSSAYHAWRPSYEGCEVCKEWRTFTNFENWFNEHYYEVEGERMSLDKDILVKGNTVYGPDTCCIVPQAINSMFTQRRSDKFDKLPYGICYDSKNKGYRVTCKSASGVSDCVFATFDEAWAKFKAVKEGIIKETAEKYKGIIEDRTYEAMINWRVEITD